jgi:mono/diheme cytochrome c family protein
VRLSAWLVLWVACESPPALPDARTFAPPPDPPQVRPPPSLPEVPGASGGAGKEIFAARCASCHGADGSGVAGKGATDLTRTGYLCRSTGERQSPADVDIDGALDRGSHAGLALSAVDRRSVVLHVRSLAPITPAPILEVPPRSAGDAKRGRTLFLAFGCWVCHGTTGAGDGSAVRSLAWGGRPYERLRALSDHRGYRCGAAPEQVYRTIAIGMGEGPQVMPPYLDLAERIIRPADIDSPTWRSKLDGKVPAEEVAALKAFYQALPPVAEVRKLSAEERRARGARHLWDLVSYVEAQ